MAQADREARASIAVDPQRTRGTQCVWASRNDFAGARDLINAAQRTGSDLGSEIKQYLIKIKNDEIKTYISLAQKQVQGRDFTSAKKSYEAAVKAAPTNATVSENLTCFNQQMEKRRLPFSFCDF